MNFQQHFLQTLLRGGIQQSKRIVMAAALVLVASFSHAQMRADSAQLRIDTLVTKLHFDSGSTLVDLDFWDNEYQMQQFMDALNGRSDTRILDVRVIGTSSPDGNLDSNASFAERRAQRVHQFLQEQYADQFTDSLCWTDSVIPEDWANVESSLLESSVKDNDILAIMVRSIPSLVLDEDGNVINTRKDILMGYDDEGEVWAQMCDSIFPDCRAAEIRVILESSFEGAFGELPGTLTIAPRPDTYYPAAIEFDEDMAEESDNFKGKNSDSKPIAKLTTSANKVNTSTNNKQSTTNTVTEKAQDKEEQQASSPAQEQTKEKVEKPVVASAVSPPTTKPKPKVEPDLPDNNIKKERTRTREAVVDENSTFSGLFNLLLYLPALISLLWLIVYILKAKIREVYHPMAVVVLAIFALATALLPSYVLDPSLYDASLSFLAKTCFLLVLPIIYLFIRVILKKGKMAIHHYALLSLPILLIFIDLEYLLLFQFIVVAFYATKSSIVAHKQVAYESEETAKAAYCHLKLIKNTAALVWFMSAYLLYLFLLNGSIAFIYVLCVVALSWFVHRFAFYADLAEGDFASALLPADASRFAPIQVITRLPSNTETSEGQEEASEPETEAEAVDSQSVEEEVQEELQEEIVPEVLSTPEPVSIVNSANTDTLSADFDQLMDVQNYYLNPNINSDSTAKMLSTNRTYLGAMLKERFNCSFSEYVAMKRVEYVKEYVSNNPEKTLSEVAQACGFSSVETLCRTYKKLTGTTPKANI